MTCRKPRRPWGPTDTAMLVYLRGKNMTDAEIAKATGHTRETVTRRRLWLGLKCSKRRGGWRPR